MRASVALTLIGALWAATVGPLVATAGEIVLRDSGGAAIPAGYVDAFADGGEAYLLNWRATGFDSFYQETGHELTVHRADGSFVRTLASDSTVAYKSFAVRQGDEVYFGLGDGIYHVAYDGSAPAALAATLGNNFDMQFAPTGEAYAVANPGWAANRVYRVDLSGADQHVPVVDPGGYSAELAIDGAGSLYYGTYFFSPDNRLVKYTAGQLAAVGTTPLALADGAKLTDLAAGMGGLAVDDAGNAVFTLGGMTLCAIEAGKDYSSYGQYAYDQWRTLTQWTMNVDTLGDAVQYAGGEGHAVFASGGGELSTLPEPAGIALLLAGAVGLLRRRRLVRR